MLSKTEHQKTTFCLILDKFRKLDEVSSQIVNNIGKVFISWNIKQYLFFYRLSEDSSPFINRINLFIASEMV